MIDIVLVFIVALIVTISICGFWFLPKKKPQTFDDHAIDIFASRMKRKMEIKRIEGRSGWHDESCTPDMLREMLYKHIRKGDPIDVANFCMMLHFKNSSTRLEDMQEFKDILEVIADNQKLMKPEEQKIVCAAERYPDGFVVPGIRHFSPDMHMVLFKSGYSGKGERAEDGFLDNFGNFLNRQQAYLVADRQGQYKPYEPFTPGTLYSEDIY